MRERSWKSLIWWVTAYAIAMALLEAAVVIDLRALFYPNGFRFPLVPIDRELATVEVAREGATLLMLLAPAALIARQALIRFAWFCFAFGVWDIFYYVWLKVFIDWPDTLLEWDILFLIPVPWVGPVIAPCVISAGLIVLAVTLLHARERDPHFSVKRIEWGLLIGGAAIMIFSFLLDPLQFLARKSELGSAWSIGPAHEATFAHISEYVPKAFDWWVFLAGCVVSVVGLARMIRRAWSAG